MTQINPSQAQQDIGRSKRQDFLFNPLSLTGKAYTKRRSHYVTVADFTAAQLIPDVTDLAIQATATQVRSASQPFVTNDGLYTAGYNKVVNITAGTGFTTGFYTIITDSTITATLDRPAGTASSTAGSAQFYLMGPCFDVSDFSELLLTLNCNTALIGSGANIRVVVQVLDLKNTSLPATPYFYNLPVGPNFSQNPVIQGNNFFPGIVASTGVINVIPIMPPFGDVIRVGISVGTAFTSGNLSVSLKLKG